MRTIGPDCLEISCTVLPERRVIRTAATRWRWGARRTRCVRRP